MAFEEKQRNLLARVLGLLGSDQDGEVLAAARRADAIVKAAGVTWSEVLGGTSTKSPTVPWNKDFSATPAPPSQDSVAKATAERVANAMGYLRAKSLGQWQATFDNLYNVWTESSYLNGGQRHMLFSIEREERAKGV